VGAKVVLVQPGGKKQYAMASTSGSYLAANDRRVFFGLGAGGSVEELRLTWPSGIEQTIRAPRLNQILRVEEPGR
jgi:hypothetical protein